MIRNPKMTLVDILWSPTAKYLHHSFLVIAVCILAIIQNNLLPLLVAIAGGIWFEITYRISGEGRLFQHGVRRQFPRRDRYFTDFREYAFALGITHVLLVASSFVFLAFPLTTHQVVHHQGGETVYGQRWFMTTFNPLTDEVRYFSSDVSVWGSSTTERGVACVAKTSEGKIVRAYVGATLRLPAEGLPMAFMKANDSARLMSLIKEELCNRFASEVVRHSIAQMPPILVLETNTFEERHGMNALGVLYNGRITISGMHVYVVQ